MVNLNIEGTNFSKIKKLEGIKLTKKRNYQKEKTEIGEMAWKCLKFLPTQFNNISFYQYYTVSKFYLSIHSMQ